MAVFNPRETQLLKTFLLAMKEFKKFPKLEYTGVRLGVKIKVVYKKFALQFIRWRFSFTRQKEYAEDKDLVNFLTTTKGQEEILRYSPKEEELLSTPEVSKVEQASEAKTESEQLQGLAQVIVSKTAAQTHLPAEKPVEEPIVETPPAEETVPVPPQEEPVPAPATPTPAANQQPQALSQPSQPAPIQSEPVLIDSESAQPAAPPPSPPESTPPAKSDLAPSSSPQPSQTKPSLPRLNLSGFKMPSSFTGALKKFGSGLGRLFQGTIGKRLGATGLSGLIGGLAGSALGPLGIAGGAGLGGLLANSASARGAVGDLAKQGIHSLSGIKRPRLPKAPSFLKKTSNKKWLLLLGLLIFLALGTGFISPGGPGVPGIPGQPGVVQPPISTLPPGSLGFSLSCPISSPKISCGTLANPLKNGCGHGSSTYQGGAKCDKNIYECNGDRYSEALYHSIDVEGGTEVRMPYINGTESVVWTRKLKHLISSDWGYRMDYTATTASGRKLELHLEHLANGAALNELSLSSGTVLGTRAIEHLHIALSVDGRWVEPIQEAGMCDKAAQSIPAIAKESINLLDNTGNKVTTGWKFGKGSYAVAIVSGMNTGEETAENVVNAVYNELDKLSKGQNSLIKPSNNIAVYLIKDIDPGSTNNGFNSRGIDINRNFSSGVEGGWSPVGCSASRYNISSEGAVQTSCSDPEKRFIKDASGNPTQKTSEVFNAYCSKGFTGSFFCIEGKTGGAAMDQPETQAIANLIKNEGIKAVLSFRAPYDGVSHTNADPPKVPKTKELAQKMQGWLKDSLGRTIPYDAYWPKYPVRGQFMDWLDTNNVIGVEIEVLNPSEVPKYLGPIQNALNYLAP